MTEQFTLEEMEKTAARFLETFKYYRVFAFHGEMGAGKTTFIQALCRVSGVKDTMGSPSFSIINEYKKEDEKIFHIDLYRLKDEEEALRAGVEDCMYSGNTSYVEWPERAPGLFPPGTVHVYLEAVDDVTRKIHAEEPD